MADGAEQQPSFVYMFVVWFSGNMAFELSRVTDAEVRDASIGTSPTDLEAAAQELDAFLA